MVTSRENPPCFMIKDLRGGRNGFEPPEQIPDVQASLVFNMDWYRASFGRRRGGSDSLSMTGGTTFTGETAFIFRHVPGATETAAELWAADTSATPKWKRLTGGTSWADVTLDDAVTASPHEINATSFNGKLFLAYKSAVDRLHVYDSAVAKVRRSGLVKAAVPTTGQIAGAVTDSRTYKICWTKQVAGVTTMRGELSDASGVVVLVAQQAQITRPTLPGEGETHWELYAASTNGVYGLVATTVVATGTVNENNVVINTNNLDPVEGTNTVFPSVRYLTTDNNRLLGAGSWTTGGFSSRVFFSPILGDSDVGDDERYVFSDDQQNFVDLNENDGGYITALSPPLQGSIYVFKYRQIYKLTPTGDLDTPYLAYNVSRAIGCISHKSLVLGEDGTGTACLYFASAIGPYRLGQNGLEYLGHDIEDLWPTVNLNATGINCHGIFSPEKHQYWLWVSTGSANSPDTIFVFNSLNSESANGKTRGGWAVYNGDLALANCSCLFSNTVGASMSFDLKPYIGRTSVNNKIYKGDTSAVDDAGAAFRAYLTTKNYIVGNGAEFFSVGYPTLMAAIQAATTIQIKLLRDYSLESVAVSISLAALGTETRGFRKDEGVTLSHCRTVAFEVGDASAVSVASWKLDKLIVPYEIEEAF
jgi:hypothetical protein